MGIELEWKFAADAATLAKVKKETAAGWRAIEMESLYYDTPARTLAARRWTLRLRRENGEPAVTLKTPAAGPGRGEWEVRCESVPEAAGPLLEQGAPPELEALVQEPLETVCGARFTRNAALLELDGATVELALDEGVLLGGGKSLPFCELEVERKTGGAEEAEAFARALASRYGLRDEPSSKFQRAFALAQS